MGCKNGTDLHAKYGGDRGLHAGCRRKSVVFCLFLSRFGIMKFMITETLIFKTIMVLLDRGYSTFSTDLLDFP